MILVNTDDWGHGCGMRTTRLIKIPDMRWNRAWMLRALALLAESRPRETGEAATVGSYKRCDSLWHTVCV